MLYGAVHDWTIYTRLAVVVLSSLVIIYYQTQSEFPLPPTLNHCLCSLQEPLNPS